jgi:glycosyltransferase involved in cell wall biosynthesis
MTSQPRVGKAIRIALVAPVEETVPPAAYGGIEQVVHLLDEDLAARGHDVLLLASGGSSSAGRLIPLTTGPLAARSAGNGKVDLVPGKEEAMRRAGAILRDERPDAVLNHSWRLLDHLGNLDRPVLTTIHYALDTEPYRSNFLARADASFVSISRSQQAALPELRFAGNVYNGVDVATLPFRDAPDDYLAYLGRVSPDKGLDTAIRIAQKAGMPLKVAAKLDQEWRPWFEDVVEPLVRRGGVELLGEISSAEKGPFLAGAVGLLHPSRWSEPFGLAAVEAMACGTPVLTLRRGAAEEVVVDGETGFVADREEGLSAAVERLSSLDRAACRRHVVARFGRTRMAEGYERLAQEAASP